MIASMKTLLVKSRESIALCISAIVLIALLLTQREFFLNPANLVSLQFYFAPLAIVALGMMLIFIVGMFDLSVGSTMAASSLLCAALISQGLPGEISLLVGVCLGAAIGAVNGWLVVYAGLNPLIATLGVMYVLRGLVDTLSGGGLPRPWMYINSSTVDGWLYAFGNATLFGVYSIFWISAAFLIIAALVLRYTTWGRSFFFVGNNPEAARSVGFDPRKTRALLFVVCGILAAIAGILVTARTGQATRFLGLNFEMQAIIACLIGGATINGGRGSVVGVIGGVALMVLIGNGFNAWEVKPEWQRVILGAILLGTLLLDVVLGKRRA